MAPGDRSDMLVARLEVLGEMDARGAVRFHVAGVSTLRGHDGKPVDVLVENFSRSGFLFLSDLEFPAGTLVAIGLSGAGARDARVVWRDGERHGCEFLVPLPQSKMERAFTGQAELLAGLEAKLQRRSAGAAPATTADPETPDATPLPSLIDRLAHGLKDMLDR
jgi:hypothetical protein